MTDPPPLTDRSADPTPTARILPLVASESNRRHLESWLEDRYDVVAADGDPDEALASCDLCLVDAAGYRRHRERLRAAKDDAAPVFLPYLLVSDVDPEAVDPDVWTHVDDVITTPVGRAELRARLDAALRTRSLSVELERQRERMERFAGLAAHDIRNPLMIARSFLDLTRTTGDHEHLDRIEAALDRMRTIVDDLVTLARTGQVVTDTDPVALVDAAERAWATVETGDATLDADGAASVTVEADESRLVELLENLFANAVEHGSTSAQSGEDASGTPPDGRLDERADGALVVRVGALDGGFYVADDGRGIPADQRDEVFEYGHTTAEDGTGFGLAAVEQIAVAHGWTLRLDESAGGGARFEISTDPG